MPEGTRSKDGRLLRFKTGFVHLAIATGLPVVPVVLHGAHRLWPLGFPLFAPGPLEVDVLEPIDTTGWSEDRSSEHAESVRQVLDLALGPDQRSLPTPEPVRAPSRAASA